MHSERHGAVRPDPRAMAGGARRGASAGAHRRRRWEPYFIAVIATLLILIAAAGLLIAHGKSQASLDRAFSAKPTQAVAATLEEANNEVITQPAPLAPTSPKNDLRDLSFAVDPNATAWNYEPNEGRIVYLTIDDGPSENTAEVLDILDRYGIKATFFVVGTDPAHFPMIAEAYRRGHTIGLHSYSHDYGTVYSSADAYFADLQAIGEVVRQQIGYIPCFVRFPGGSSNVVSDEFSPGIMDALTSKVIELGYQYYDWNVSTGDGSDHSVEELIAYGCDAPDTNSIMLLCHDSATKQSTVDALPAIIEYYRAQGYAFEALNRQSWVCHHDF